MWANLYAKAVPSFRQDELLTVNFLKSKTNNYVLVSLISQVGCLANLIHVSKFGQEFFRYLRIILNFLPSYLHL